MLVMLTTMHDVQITQHRPASVKQSNAIHNVLIRSQDDQSRSVYACVCARPTWQDCREQVRAAVTHQGVHSMVIMSWGA